MKLCSKWFWTHSIQIELCNLQTAKIDEDDNAAMNWVTTIHEVCPCVNSFSSYSIHLLNIAVIHEKNSNSKIISLGHLRLNFRFMYKLNIFQSTDSKSTFMFTKPVSKILKTYSTFFLEIAWSFFQACKQNGKYCAKWKLIVDK